MKTLLLLRHGKSAWGQPRLGDFDRPLNPRGRQAAPLMAEFILERGLAPDLVLCSTAQRARETWDLMAPILDGERPVRFDDALYLAAPQAMFEILRQVDEHIECVMLIGHNPGLQKLAVGLAGDGDARARMAMAAKYPTAALAVIGLDIPEWSDLRPGAGRLLRFVRPKELMPAGPER